MNNTLPDIPQTAGIVGTSQLPNRLDVTVTNTETQGQMWMRQWRLLIAKRAANPNDEYTKAYDLSQFHSTFHIQSTDMQTPNTLNLRIYNLAPETRNALIREYDQVTVEAGYRQAQFGMIFRGGIRQFKRGKENVTDDFLEIVAGDGDYGYNFGFMNMTLGLAAQAATWQDMYQQCCNWMQVQPDEPSMTFLAGAGNEVTFGPRVTCQMARVMARRLADSVGARWSIQNGRLIIQPYQTVRPGSAVVLAPNTGLIGIPQATEQGVEVRCLMNPNIQIGTSVLISRELINETTVIERALGSTQVPYIATVAENNLYRVVCIDHTGDTRGQEWYMDLVCLAMDRSLPENAKVVDPLRAPLPGLPAAPLPVGLR